MLSTFREKDASVRVRLVTAWQICTHFWDCLWKTRDLLWSVPSWYNPPCKVRYRYFPKPFVLNSSVASV